MTLDIIGSITSKECGQPVSVVYIYSPLNSNFSDPMVAPLPNVITRRVPFSCHLQS